MYFKDIPYKDREKAFLRKQVADQRIPHAQIFVGHEGSGALALAIAFASYLVCTDRQDGDSCGTCRACTQSHKFLYPDIHWSFPVVKADGKNREDSISDDFLTAWREMIATQPYMSVSDWQSKLDAGSSRININVKECHSMMQKLALQPLMDGPKVLILWMPEYLGKEGNRLLKFIEEPTDNTFIILVAQDQDLILNTILSRCQLVKVLPYAFGEIEAFISDRFPAWKGKASQIASLAEGNITKALHMVKGDDVNLSEEFVQWMRIAYKCDIQEILSFSQEVASWSKDAQIQFMRYGLHFLREMMMWQLTHTSPNLSDKEKKVAEGMLKIINQEMIEQISLILENAQFFLLRNANMKISYMADTLLIGNILKNIPITSTKQLSFVY